VATNGRGSRCRKGASMFRGKMYGAVVVPVLVVALALVPFAAQAAPAGRNVRSAPLERSWNGGSLWSSAGDWLAMLRGLIVPVWEKDTPPPGQSASPNPSSSDREGTGIDPHGGPRPVVP